MGRASGNAIDALDKIVVQPIDVSELVACLKRIRASIQHWTREKGARGYLDFIAPIIAPSMEAGIAASEDRHAMSADAAPDALWSRLYDLAVQVRELTPWESMSSAWRCREHARRYSSASWVRAANISPSRYIPMRTRCERSGRLKTMTRRRRSGFWKSLKFTHRSKMLAIWNRKTAAF